VLIAIHRSLDSQLLNLDIDRTFWVKIMLCNKNIFIGACYVPPSSAITVYEQISNSVTSISDIMAETDEIIIFGDFNRPHLDFIADEDSPNVFWPCNIRDSTDELFLDDFFKNDLYQISQVKNSRLIQLDLIFSSITNDITVSEASIEEQILKNSLHHSAIVVKLKTDLVQHRVSDDKNTILIMQIMIS
jgi:Endonuclease-reverse transcriptase